MAHHNHAQGGKYDQSPEWEEACLKTRRNPTLRLKRLEKFSLHPSDVVLDLGCGDGLNITILRQMGIKNVTGLDISRQLLTEAKKNNPKNKFYLGSADNLPFRNEQFTVVLVDSVFHHLLRYNPPIREIRRVLKYGGLLCFIEPHRSIFRELLDFITLLPGSYLIPGIGERSRTYKEEIHLMRHWLATEHKFFETLERWKFQKVFFVYDFLSAVAEYRKTWDLAGTTKLKSASVAFQEQK